MTEKSGDVIASSQLCYLLSVADVVVVELPKPLRIIM
jgi:hypothetical protein